MTIYNASFMDNVTSIVDLFTGISDVTHSGDYSTYLIGYLLLISFFLIFLILSMRQGFIEVLIVDCFLTTLLATLLLFVGMVNAIAIILPLIMLVITLILFFIGGGK